MKKPVSIFIIIQFILCFTGVTFAQKGYEVEEFSAKDLKSWESYGMGALKSDHGQTVMYETEGSRGYMLVSPTSYGENTIVSYDIMPLNSATVLVLLMSAHTNENYQLNLDAAYDGNVKYLFNNLNMYMFAFHNAAHNKPGPLVRKFPRPGIEPLLMASKNVTQVGKYHHVEMKMEREKLWFRIDGKVILKIEDPDYFRGGKVVLRLRGTGPETAACLIKNLKIYSREQ